MNGKKKVRVKSDGKEPGDSKEGPDTFPDN